LKRTESLKSSRTRDPQASVAVNQNIFANR
jgi:hypothetical protein